MQASLSNRHIVGFTSVTLSVRSTLSAVGLVLMAMALLAPVRALAPDTVSSAKVGSDEIRIDGRISKVILGAKQLTLEVDSFTLPTGKASRVTPPKLKTVLIGHGSTIHVRGDVTRNLELGDLRPARMSLSWGRDSGSGNPLTARFLAAWNRQNGGQFNYDLARTGTSAVSPSRPTTSAASSQGTVRSWAVIVAPFGR
jgi:hypothetical protein